MGSLIQICIADAASLPMRSVDEVECVSGRGLAGDRYFLGSGKFSPPVQKPSHEVTLVEVEEIETFRARYGLSLQAQDFRRNLVTRGIRLNELVGRRFAINSV